MTRKLAYSESSEILQKEVEEEEECFLTFSSGTLNLVLVARPDLAATRLSFSKD